MKVFADTGYFVALINERDQWYSQAIAASQTLAGAQLVTTSDVLVEFLNFYSEARFLKQTALENVRDILLRLDVEIVMQTPDIFHAAIDLYEARMDKGYSLTDCISMNVCRARNITDVLTHDNHFRQEGFNVLL